MVAIVLTSARSEAAHLFVQNVQPRENSWSIRGGENFAGGAHSIRMGRLCDSSKTEYFAGLDTGKRDAKIYARWKKNSYDVLLVNARDLSVNAHWVSETLEVVVTPGKKIPKESVPKDCICSAIAVPEYYLRISATNARPFFVRLNRLYYPSLLVQIDKDGVILGDQRRHLNKTPISQFQGSFGNQSLFTCDGPDCLMIQ
jgi:hypothetical protein